MNSRLETVKKFTLAYRKMCKPLCKELELPQTALDILLFLGNNPAYRTARDIVEIRCIKANLVSVHVDRLVREGSLERQQVPGPQQLPPVQRERKPPLPPPERHRPYRLP